MSLKALFLAFLIVSSIAVTSAVMTQKTEVFNTFSASFERRSKGTMDESALMEPIDEDGPGGRFAK